MVSDTNAAEALARLGPEERAWVESFRGRIRAEFGERIRDIRLFGSKVRGDAHDESDIDLLVLMDGLDSRSRYRIHEIASEISGVLAVITADFEQYHLPVNRASGFYKEMRKESVRL